MSLITMTISVEKKALSTSHVRLTTLVVYFNNDNNMNELTVAILIITKTTTL